MGQTFGRRVLIVEDDSIVATTIADIFEDAGYDVIGPVRNEQEALRAVEVERPQAAILDFSLELGNTLELAALLKRHGVPVLFVTGNAAQLMVGRQGARCLQKPFEDVEILRAVNDMLTEQVA
jgi:DNA-binding response OmpR family regulator